MIYEIKEKITEIADVNPFVRRMYVMFREKFIAAMSIVPDEVYAKWFYRIYTKKTLNIKEPKLLNEKLWWLKLNNRNPMLTVCSDKHLVRKYVTDCGYPEILIPQVGAFDSADEINFGSFTSPVIAKCNNTSGGHVFYTPGDETFDEKAAKNKLNKALKQKYYLISREWNYKDIPPKVVVEKIIRDKNGELPKDFRFFCFDGVPKLLMMDFGVFNDKGQHMHEFPRNIYDMDFNLMPIRWGRDNYSGEVKKPENFEKMKEIAARLSQPFPMCRVDLYNLDGTIYFGEITFYHGGCCQQISPPEWDERIASWIDLNSSKIVKG